MSGGDFLDSNVVLYAFDKDERKYRIARGIIAHALGSDDCISFQVVQEVLRKLSLDGTELAALALEQILVPLCRVDPSASLYELALATRRRYRYSFYDSLIIAAALEADCKRLLTEDMQDGQRIAGLLIENPFRDT